MPFAARVKSTGERYNVFEKDPKEIRSLRGDLVCPICDTDMTPVIGMFYRPHFRHITKCTTIFKRHGESYAHMAGKEKAAQVLSSRIGGKIDFEVPFDEIKRIADVVLTSEDGIFQIAEVQLSPITAEELRERNTDYQKAGAVAIYWFLGPKLKSKEIEAAACEFAGGFCRLYYDAGVVDEYI